MADDGSYKAAWTALRRSQALIEFTPDGVVVDANDVFCSLMGYPLSRLIGQQHSMFCLPDYVSSPEYQRFWAKLGRGEFDAGEYCRRNASGDDVWLQATYNPIFSTMARPVAF